MMQMEVLSCLIISQCSLAFTSSKAVHCSVILVLLLLYHFSAIILVVSIQAILF